MMLSFQRRCVRIDRVGSLGAMLMEVGCVVIFRVVLVLRLLFFCNVYIYNET